MYSITELIPQRPPIVMVDEFLGIEGNLSRTRLVVREDNLFVCGGVLDECGIIEHMAQSAAARVGYLFREKGEKIPLGYIGSINDFTVARHPKTGEEMMTVIEVMQEVFHISLVAARCEVDGRCIAACKMKIYLEP